mmetsp:Transcript_5927/g.7689  ORF Transcript_5927/g.7689 Transcript_5927/m.7689 type:complete len:202 (-) Transcript_5927:107-712(-)
MQGFSMRQRSFPKLALVNLMMMLLLGNENFIFRATVAEEHSSLLQKGSSLQGGNTRKSSHDALDTIFAKGGLGNKRNLRTKSDQNDQNLSLDSMEENEMRVAVTNEFEELFLLLVYVCEAGGQTFTYKTTDEMSGPWEECRGKTGEECKRVIDDDPTLESEKIQIVGINDSDVAVSRIFDACRVVIYVDDDNVVMGVPSRG